MLRGYPKSDIFCEIWHPQPSVEISQCGPWVATRCFSVARSMYLIHQSKRKMLTWFSSNGCQSSKYTIPSSVQRGYPKFSILNAIWESTYAEMTQYEPQGGQRCYQKLFWSSLHIKGRLWCTSAAMDVSPCSTAPHFLWWWGTPNLTFWL